MVRVHLFVYPTGEWAMTLGRAATPPLPGEAMETPLEVCVLDRIAATIGARLPPFRSLAARHVARAVRVR